jgi:sugar fermentation stimulation protein A
VPDTVPRLTFAEPVVMGRFVRRYKRFFVDVEIDGVVHTAHTANTGAMTGMLIEGAPVLLTRHSTKKRKLELEVEAIDVGTSWVVCNTIRANKMAAVLLRAGVFEALGSDVLGAEVRVGDSRIDFQVGNRLVEVKSVTLREGHMGLFPDTVSERALKHATLLLEHAPHSAALFLCQRTDVDSVAPAERIQPAYAAALRVAAAAGVIMVAARVGVEHDDTTASLVFAGIVPVVL